MEELINVEFIPNLVDGRLIIANSDKIMATIKELTSQAESIVIMDDFDKKRVKEIRASVNKRKDEISRARRGIIKKFAGEFEETCKTYEKALESCSNNLGQKIRDYDNEQEVKRWKIEIKLTDENTLKKVSDYLTNNAIDYTVKEN